MEIKVNNINENIFCNASATATLQIPGGQYVVSFNPTIAFNLNLLKHIYFLL
jgi:CHASE1-domain containing sensor protein